MKSCCRLMLLAALAVMCWGTLFASAQQAAKPLTEQELVYLLQKKVSSDALANMVESFGVTFQLDPEVLDRLKKAGAQDVLLKSIERKAKPIKSGVEATKSESATPVPEAVPPPAQLHLEHGQRMLENHDYEGALLEFAEADRIRPQWEQVFYHRGLALAALGFYSDAAAEWKKYLTVAPAGVDRVATQQKITDWESQASKIAKARSLLNQGDQQLQRHDSGGSAQSFREAVRLNNSVGTLFALARVQLLVGDYKELAITANQALALDPQSALAKLYLADAELRQGNAEGSMGTLEEGLTLNPNLAYGRALLGRVLRQRANQRGGRQKQTGEFRGNADSAEERNRLGWVLWNGGHFRDALEELYKATLLNPVEENWQCDLAYARITQRDTAGALAAARQAVRLNSESACGHHALALAMEGSGRHEQAALEFQEAERLSSALGAGSLLRQGAPAGNSTTDRR